MAGKGIERYATITIVVGNRTFLPCQLLRNQQGQDRPKYKWSRLQRDSFGWIGWFNPVDLLGDPVEICTLSLTGGISSLISTGFDFQSGGFF